MAKPERVLRMSGSYHRKEGVSEEEFHRFSRYHAVKCAKIHEKYGILKYQIVRELLFICSCSIFLISSANRPTALLLPKRWLRACKLLTT